MKTIRLACFLAAVLSLPLAACARIGETEAEIAVRYGKSRQDVTKDKGGDYHDAAPVLLYQKDGINIRVAFRGGQSVAETFWKLDGSDWQQGEINALLDASKGASTWHCVFPTSDPVPYVREDELLLADHDHTKHTLTIEWHDLRSDHPTQPERSIHGF